MLDKIDPLEALLYMNSFRLSFTIFLYFFIVQIHTNYKRTSVHSLKKKSLTA